MDTPTLAELRARLPELTLRDERRLRRRLDALGNQRRAAPPTEALPPGIEQLIQDVQAAEATLARRRATVPAISYPPELPVSQRKDEILAAIRDHQVVIVAGETGSGKTTQLPKICLELGRGVRGLIGHTQPRRLAARTVAARIAEELHSEPGGIVGHKMRFTDQVGRDTLVKLMTDGILLAELQSDRGLYQYDTLIIDEAHERSLNIDFILGYVKQLLPRRRDLKVVITSATIDPERFAQHFGGAPIVEVSGRTYPVEVRYRPILPEDDTDQTQAIGDAVQELCAEGPGDILVFLSGEREIRDTADALGRLHLRNTHILPLYARLSTAEQHRVFQPHTGRRVVLATNVAETSLTVPGIKYVVDPGTARISRYSHRTKVQRLPIEPISQASANQRKGRCGRTSDGICIRLYSEVDFLARPEFTDPEILRTNLASVILQMTAIGLGDIAAFGFLDPPDRRNIADGVALLGELGALDGGRLTSTGRKLAQLPVDPRLARMILEADRNGCVREVMVIAAALSIQDPRERPADLQQAADDKHARFRDKDSDFLTYLNLWRYLDEQQRTRSSSQFRRMCRTEFLNYLRVREWQDLYSQLRQIARSVAITVNPADAEVQPDRVHQSILAGLLSHIGLRDSAKNDYQGARNARFAIFPGSALFAKPPQWIMAAELVETTRLWARVVAKIEPAWAESLAGHLVKRTYSEPHWEKKQGSVMAYEKVTLYGVPLVASRKVHYGRIDAELSRELFIRHALVEGDWATRHEFFHDNRRLLEEVEELEHRSRRRDILVDDETLFAFYDQRIGAEVVSGRHFDAWWKKTRRAQPELLNFEKSMLINERAGGVDARDYPDVWPLDGVPLALTYQFEPGTDADGVTVHIPLAILGRVTGAGFDWQVPGLRQELVTALLRSLPKALRRNFVPVPDFAADAVVRMVPGEGSLLDALERQLRQLTGVVVPREAWDLDRVPEHLKITYRITDESGAALAEGKDLLALRQQLAPKLRAELAEATVGLTRSGLKTWDFGTLPRQVRHTRAGFPVTAFPALVDEGDTVAVRVFDTEAAQLAAHRAGTRRLLLLNLPAPAKFVQGRLSNQAKLALSRAPHRNALDLLDDCAGCAVDGLVAEQGGLPWDEREFELLRDGVRLGLVAEVLEVVATVQQVLASMYPISQRLSSTANPAFVPAYTDIRAQLDRLVYRGFVTATGAEYLPELPRYLLAVERRLDKLPENPQRDRERMRGVTEVEQAYRDVAAQAPDDPAVQQALWRVRWMLEELRVITFAQALGTPYPVSDKRIYRALDAITW